MEPAQGVAHSRGNLRSETKTMHDGFVELSALACIILTCLLLLPV